MTQTEHLVKCGFCGKELNTKEENSIYLGMFERWYHADCATAVVDCRTDRTKTAKGRRLRWFEWVRAIHAEQARRGIVGVTPYQAKPFNGRFK